jgi:hypothetical protein
LRVALFFASSGEFFEGAYPWLSYDRRNRCHKGSWRESPAAGCLDRLFCEIPSRIDFKRRSFYKPGTLGPTVRRFFYCA